MLDINTPLQANIKYTYFDIQIWLWDVSVVDSMPFISCLFYSFLINDAV